MRGPVGVAYRGRGPGTKIDKERKKKKKKVFHEGAGPWGNRQGGKNYLKKKRSSTNKRKETPPRHRERGALGSAGPRAIEHYATFAIYSRLLY